MKKEQKLGKAEELKRILQLDTDKIPEVRENIVTDPELFIRKAFELDPQSGISLLFKHYYTPLCSHAIRFVSSKVIAEDIVSEIFLRFFDRKHYQDVSASYRSYLYRSVRNSALNHLKREANRLVELDQNHDLAEAQSKRPDELLRYDELFQQVQLCIGSMPAQRRKIYLMNRFDGKKYAEIASELSISVRTVEVHIRTASHFLRDTLKKKGLLSSFLIFIFLF